MTRPQMPGPRVGRWAEGTQPSPHPAWSSTARSKDNLQTGPRVGVDQAPAPCSPSPPKCVLCGKPFRTPQRLDHRGQGRASPTSHPVLLQARKLRPGEIAYSDPQPQAGHVGQGVASDAALPRGQRRDAAPKVGGQQPGQGGAGSFQQLVPCHLWTRRLKGLL